MEEDILFLEGLLIEDPFPPHPIILSQTKSPIEEPKHSFRMGYKHFSTTLVTKEVAESSTKNLVPIPRECEVTLDNGSESIEPVKDDFSLFTTISNSLFNNNKINSDELNSHVESNSDESTSNHDTVKFDNLDEFSGPLIPIHIVVEERIRREHAEYINRMEMLFTINPRHHPSTYANTNVESFSSLPIPVQENGEVDVVDDLRIDNYISNSEHDSSESEDSNFDNPSVPLPPPEPPDEEFDFEVDFGNEILVVRNSIVKFECIDARVVLSYFMFVIFDKVFPLFSAESEDTIFDPGLQVKQNDDGIFISQDKYVADILKNFGFSLVKTTSTLIEPNKALIKDAEAEDVDVHLYGSIIGSLMYLTAARPDIMFAVCACARFQVTPKTSHLHVVKRIFRYLKGQRKLGLWYPRDSPFDLEAFSGSDYAGASLNMKSTTGGCQFLGKS
nr:uncharacterized mitochondrial protein AtMg00810-like [Tanacetum cinerariifolium]